MTNFNSVWKDFLKNGDFDKHKQTKKQQLSENNDIYGKIDEEDVGILGRHVWPSADSRIKDPDLRANEKDTDIERELYIQLHKHFGTSSYFLKAGEPPLGSAAIEAIEKILSADGPKSYPDVFKTCRPTGTMLRGMQVPIEWLKNNAPNAFKSIEEPSEDSDSEFPRWAVERGTWKDDWGDPVSASFEFKSGEGGGKYGGVSSWTPNWRTARMFSITQNKRGMVPCILYASCASGLFLDTTPFAKYIGGYYKRDYGIKRLNPQRGKEKEFILFGNCQVHAIQVMRDIPDQITENTEKMLWEVTDEELEHINTAMHEMDPDEMAFNSLFDGQMRRILPFSTLNPDTQSGKFIDFLNKLHQGEGPKGEQLGWRWKPDFSTGKMTRNRPIYKTKDEYEEASIVPGKELPKRSPEMMKIGKVLNKIATLGEKYDAAREVWRQGGKVQTEVEARLRKALYNLVGNPRAFGMAVNNTEEIRKMARFWELTGAALFKGDPNAGKENTYSIIVTRSPLDILRASDFDRIESCHSPPSRQGGGSYYKCIVAEAHGHGAVAYIVKTEDLLEAYGEETIEKVENNDGFQEDEVFYDKMRPSESGEIIPISRVRLRQMKYKNKDFAEMTELAVPEMRVYGQSFDDFYDTVLNFAHNSQKEELELAPRTEDDELDLNKFTLYGGSYEDTNRALLLTNLFNIPREDASGSIKQDTETQDKLPDDLRGLEELYNRDCAEITDRWNHRYAVAQTSYNVEEDGTGGAYIEVGGTITLRWDMDDWKKWPHAGNIVDILGDVKVNMYDAEWIADSYPTQPRNIGAGKIGFTFSVEPEGVTEFMEAYHQPYAADPEVYEDWCIALNRIDDRERELKEHIDIVAKMHGWMEGGKFLNLAREAEYGDVDVIDWDVEVDGEFPEYYSVAAETHIYFGENDLANVPKFSYDQWETLLNSRDLRLEFRKLLLAEPKQELGTQYNLSIDSRYEIPVKAPVVPEIRYFPSFSVDEDVPDEMIDLFKHTIIETDDEDLLKATLIKAINNVWGNVKQEQVVENFNKQNKKLDDSYFVKRWKLNFN